MSKSKFAEKSIQVAIASQMENGNVIITNEIITENGRDTTYASIYEVHDGLIKNVRFVRWDYLCYLLKNKSKDIKSL